MGNLNPNLDYALHPKLGFERRINAIYYLSDPYGDKDGRNFALWNNTILNEPGKIVEEYSTLFNRMIWFDTSENSWHGLSKVHNPSGSKCRKSLAS
jgi:hypothetical protein